jgi:septum site-determining protein MinC
MMPGTGTARLIAIKDRPRSLPHGLQGFAAEPQRHLQSYHLIFQDAKITLAANLPVPIPNIFQTPKIFSISTHQRARVNSLLTISPLNIINEFLTQMTKVLTDARSIRIKGRSFLAVMLSPDLPFDDWLIRLDDLAARSAGFFLGRPVVLDVTDLAIDRAQLKELIAELSGRNVSIMGIEGGRPSILGPGMPPALKGGRPAADFEVAAKEANVDLPEKPALVEPRPVTQSLIIREPVRSGQSVIFPEGDVTIIGSVASGAEIVAGGSVHIYGALRGRVMAGSVGNTSARIFCRKLEAELVAIDGTYKMAEDLASELHGKAVQLWLQDDTIMAEKLN